MTESAARAGMFAGARPGTVYAPPEPSRLLSLDVIRGLVMVLMAIDHVRVYSGIPAGGDTPGVFFTRWVTHFCAPAFVFLAGTGAFLHGRKLGNTGELAKFLATRGILLVILEVTLIRASWTFNVAYSQFVLAGVIWMVGWCMVLMAAVVWLPLRAIAALGLLVIFGQDLIVPLASLLPDWLRAGSLSGIWDFFYWGIRQGDGDTGISVLYTIVPWIGVMATGYAFGALMLKDTAARRALLYRIGLTATAVFIVVAGIQLWLNPAPDGAPGALFRFLNQNKYPASQLFLLMTLGPTIAVLPLVEQARGRVIGFLAVFGRVPLFYYILHIPVIHIGAHIVTFMREGSLHPEWYATAPFTSVPEDARWSLWVLYLIFVLVVAALYVPCRWYSEVKSRNRGGWLRYL